MLILEDLDIHLILINIIVFNHFMMLIMMLVKEKLVLLEQVLKNKQKDNQWLINLFV